MTKVLSILSIIVLAVITYGLLSWFNKPVFVADSSKIIESIDNQEKLVVDEYFDSEAVAKDRLQIFWLNNSLTLKSKHSNRSLIIYELSKKIQAPIILKDIDISFLGEAMSLSVESVELKQGLRSLLQDKPFDIQMNENGSQVDKIIIYQSAASQQSALVSLKEQLPNTPELDNSEPSPPNENDFETVDFERLKGNAYEKDFREHFYSYSLDKQHEILASMSPVGDDLAFLSNTLLNNLDTHSRVIAADRLANGSSYAATHSLLEALDDSSSDVVITAIESLEKIGDRSVLSYLKRYQLRLGDDAVARALENAISSLDANELMLSDQTH